MIILVDGPEKAGKSTLIEELQLRLTATVRRWGPVSPDDRVYAEPLLADARADHWVIWDRGWPSEHVYGKLLKRNRRLTDDPFLGEWLYGRAVQSRGLRVMLFPDKIVELDARRDATDLPVSAYDEFLAYKWYAQTYGYTTLTNDYTRIGLLHNIALIMADAKNLGANKWMNLIGPPTYAGPLDADIVFVGEKMGTAKGIPGAFLPFTSQLTTVVGRKLKHKALKFGWTNVGDVPEEFFEGRVAVACGVVADGWLSKMGCPRITIPHPAWLYRYENRLTWARRETTDKLLTLIGEYENVQPNES